MKIETKEIFATGNIKSKGSVNSDASITNLSAPKEKKIDRAKKQVSKGSPSEDNVFLISLCDRYSSSSKRKARLSAFLTGAEFLPNQEPSSLIKKYFLKKTNRKIELRKSIARHINSVESVLEILDWSIKGGVQEAYDGAIALLAECGNILIEANNKLHEDFVNTNDVITIEEKWEVLIKGIAYAQNISPQQRFDAITKFIPTQKRRLLKAAIIDALVIMQDEISADSINSYLDHFSSSDEPDKYIQEYAKEALE